MTTRSDFLGEIRREMSKTRGLFEVRPVPRPPDAGQAFEMVKRQMESHAADRTDQQRIFADP